MRRHIAIYIGIGSNEYIVSDYNFSDDHRVDANPDLVSDHGRTLSHTTALLTDRDTLVKIAAFPDHCVSVDRDIIRMSQIETGADVVQFEFQAVPVLDSPLQNLQNTFPLCLE